MKLNIAALDPRYRRYRAELRLATDISPQDVALWMRSRGDELAAGYVATGEEGSLQDYEAWIRHQYARAMGIAP